MNPKPIKEFHFRDISWLSFNARVLQEAADLSVPLKERVRFLGIFSNNLDEFFRVRVATLRRMLQFTKPHHQANQPEKVLEGIQLMVLKQQAEFDRIWQGVQKELAQTGIHLKRENELNKQQQIFVKQFFDEQVRSNIIPLMIEHIPNLPYLREKSLYLGVKMFSLEPVFRQQYAIIEVPASAVGRFIQLPSPTNQHHIILLEDVIRFCLPDIFAYFEFNEFSAHVFKVTKDAEMDIDNDIATSLIQKLEKGIKNRRKGKPVRFVYDKEMDAGLLQYLIRRLNLSHKDNIIPGGRIHNFRHFMDFPTNVFPASSQRLKPFTHPDLRSTQRVTDMLLKKDILLSFPYHSFDPVIDLLRESAIDPNVISIKITAYRLASNSKVINALINAHRNGKQVTVMLELKARFDEEANLEWKAKLEEEGVKVLIGIPNQKVHAKLCVIKKKLGRRTISYGFVSTGNLNEKTAKVYADYSLLTANRRIMADINRIFTYLENPKIKESALKACRTIIPSPISLRKELQKMIQHEIKLAQQGKKASITLKVNSLADEPLITKLYEAAAKGVKVELIVRGICALLSQNKKFKHPIKAISIVDEYLEHARVFIFKNGGKEKVYLSSADWMTRNIDHRVEATCPVLNKKIIRELKDMLSIQLKDNVKARVLDNQLKNQYVEATKDQDRVRSQIEIYHYLFQKIDNEQTPSRH